ncbi:MAG: hypothetical protein KDB03_12855 [Planctomycetales bacterium]|nr:hypothetical protein [Planctomycetales bacterium]
MNTIQLVRLVLIGLMLSTCGNAIYAQAPPPIEEEAMSEQRMHIMYLKYAAAQDVQNTLVQTMPAFSEGAMAVCEQRLNMLILRADEKVIREVEELIKVLDTPTPNADSQTIRSYALPAELRVAAMNVVKSLDLPIRVATDDSGLIVVGDEISHKTLEAAIKSLEATTSRTIQDVTIQVIWLTESAEANAPVFDNEVSKALQDRGFRPLRTLSIIEVASRVGTKCFASGAATLGTFSCEISLQPTSPEITLELDISAQYENSQLKQDELRLNSTLTSPLKRWLMFGVSQRNTRAADEKGTQPRDIFLVRITPLEPLVEK